MANNPLIKNLLISFADLIWVCNKAAKRKAQIVKANYGCSNSNIT